MSPVAGEIWCSCWPLLLGMQPFPNRWSENLGFSKRSGVYLLEEVGLRCQSGKSCNRLLQYLGKVYWIDLSLIVNEKNCTTLEKENGLNGFFGNRLLTATFFLPYFSNSLLFFPEWIPLVLLASIIFAGGK